jgi:hypothetical protein
MGMFGPRRTLSLKDRQIQRDRRFALALEIAIGVWVLTAIAIVALAVYYFLYWAP